MAEVVTQTIGILGAGGIGGMLAALLSRTGHNIVCIGRERGPLTFESPLFTTLPVKALFVEEYERVLETLFITVKSPFLSDSLQRVERAQIGAVISLLNGIGHAEVIRKFLPVPLAVGMIGSVEVAKTGSTIRQLSAQRPHIDLASRDMGTPRLSVVATLLSDAGIDAKILGSEEEVIWKKLVRINAIAGCTAASQKPIGIVRKDPLWRERLEKMLEEGAAIAKAAGVEIDWKYELSVVEGLPEGLTTSLQRDIAAGKSSELDSIVGGVLKRAGEYGIRTPATEEIYRKIHAMI